MLPLLCIALALLAGARAAPSGCHFGGNSTKTRVFDFTFSWENRAPDGFGREMLLVNGKSPGPVIKVEQDDWVVVNVQNKSPFRTSLHFHGIEMRQTPWSDGVPGVTQRPIAPEGSFTYRFQALQYGSYWYHAHARGQIEDGLYGAIVIHPRRREPNPFHTISNNPAAVRAMERAERHVHPLVLYDFMHITSEQKKDITPRAGVEISCYDSILFNGKGRVNCLPEGEMVSHLDSVQKAALNLVPGAKLTDKGCIPAIVMATLGGDVKQYTASAMPAGIFDGCKETKGSTEVIKTPAPSTDSWVAIDIVGAINFITGVVSIDGHDMWVYAMDGSYIEPQKVQAISVDNGDRYSVLVKPERAGQFKIRCHAAAGSPQMIIGHAILKVPGETASDEQPRQWIDIGGKALANDTSFFNQTTAYPYPPQPIAQKADAMHVLNMRSIGTSYIWALNSTALDPATLERETPPVLFDPNATIAKHDNVTIVTKYGTWVDLVLFASVRNMPPHPIHKHGVKMFRIGSGTGPFRWTSVEDAAKEVPGNFNLVNPPRKDTVVSLPTGQDVGWVVVRYQVTNPGAWLLHCHISNHMMGGMVMVIVDGIDAWPNIPPEYLN